MVTHCWYLGRSGSRILGDISRRKQVAKRKPQEEGRRPIQADIRYLDAEWDELKGLELSQWEARIK